MSILDAHGAIVQHPAVRGATGTHASAPAELVSLASGARAYFLVTSVNVNPSPGCPTEFHGTTLRVYPPDNTAPLYLPGATLFCNLGVGPVTSTTTG